MKDVAFESRMNRLLIGRLKMLDWVHRQFEQNKLARRLIMVWICVMVSIVLLRATENMALVTAAVASLVGSVTLILSVPLAFYFKIRKEEDKEK